MDTLTFAVVLAAAFLHSSWNLAVKKDGDQFRSLALMAATSGFLCLLVVPFAPSLAPGAWTFLAASAPLHAGYRIFLAQGYRHGDMSQVYPIARGAIPLFVLALSVVLLASTPSPYRLGAVALIVAGILGLTFVRGVPRNVSAVASALVTAAFVACFTLLDARGAAIAGAAFTYILWVFVFEGLLMLLAGFVVGPARMLDYTRQCWRTCLLNGLVMSFAHGLIIWALARSDVALVSALRESSVVISMVLSAVILKERLGMQRIACTLLVVAGIVMIATT